MSAITYRFAVYLKLDLDEDFDQENAESKETQRDLQKRVFRYLQRWPDFPKAADVELLDYELKLENPREKGEDDGREYADPRDHRDGRE